MQNPGQNTHAPAIARLTLEPSGNKVLVCPRCLNWWFDEADNDETYEPSEIRWLQRYTAR
jgi:hypothetical protein